MAKTFTRQAESGAAGIALIHRVVSAMGHIWHERRLDHGIDGEIELVDPLRRRPLNRAVLVQSKAGRRFPGESRMSFHYVCDEDDAEYWSEANVPVILVCSHPDSGEAWWAPVSEILKDPARRRTRRIDFDKSRDRFDDSAAAAILDLAVPPTEGLYSPPPPMPERLTSNLLRVERLPDTIWAAPAIVDNNREAWRLLRSHKVFARDWMVIDRTLFSFRCATDAGWQCVVDGPGEALDSSEWAESKSPDVQRNFVRLLNQTLAESFHHDLRQHPKRRYLYFRATDDLLPRQLSTGRSRSGRVVFRAYPDADEPATARHFRHHALSHQLVRLGDDWFLELSPTYHFTSDGQRDLPWGAELVKGMKRREKNAAVRGLVLMWAGYLGRGSDLFVDRDDAPIRFGELECFDVEHGVDERGWQRAERKFQAESDVPTLFEAS